MSYSVNKSAEMQNQIRSDIQEFIDRHPIVAIDVLVQQVLFDRMHSRLLVKIEFNSDYGPGVYAFEYPVKIIPGLMPIGDVVRFNEDLLCRRVSASYKEKYKELRRKSYMKKRNVP